VPARTHGSTAGTDCVRDPGRCSVQRIAKRAGVLSQQRIDVLDSIQFDWSGADALS